MQQKDKILSAEELNQVFEDCETLDDLGFEAPINPSLEKTFTKNNFSEASFSVEEFVERFLSSPFTDKQNISRYIDPSTFDNHKIFFSTMFSAISLKDKELLLPHFKKSLKTVTLEDVKNYSPKVDFDIIPSGFHKKLFNNLSEKDILNYLKPDSYSIKVFRQFTPDTIMDDSLFRDIFILNDSKYSLGISEIPVSFHLRSNDWWNKNPADFFTHLLNTTVYYQFNAAAIPLIEHLDTKLKIITSTMLHSLNPASDIVRQLMEDESLEPIETARLIAIVTLCTKDIPFTKFKDVSTYSLSKKFIALLNQQLDDYDINNFSTISQTCKDTSSIYSVENSFFALNSHKGWLPLEEYLQNFDLTVNDLNFDENTSIILKRMLFVHNNGNNQDKMEVYEGLIESFVQYNFQFDGDRNAKIESESKLQNLFYSFREHGALLYCHEFLSNITQQNIVYNESPETLFQKIAPFADELIMRKLLAQSSTDPVPSVSVKKRKF